MSTVLESNVSESLESPPFPVRRWTVSEYRRLAETGFLTDDDRVELLEGWIVPKMTHRPPHAWAVSRVERLLKSYLGDRWYIRVQSPIDTADSEPEPDVAVVRGSENDYLHNHPTTGEIALVVEVAETSIIKDRRKARIYADALIPEYWIINLAEGMVERFTIPDPKTHTYRQTVVLKRGDKLTFDLDCVQTGTLTVADLLPRDDA